MIILLNGFLIVVGGVIGLRFARFFSDDIKSHMNLYFGCISVATGIYLLTTKGANLPVASLAILLGGFCGELLRLDVRIASGAAWLQAKVGGSTNREQSQMLITVIILYCTSVTGILGVLDGGISGDWTVFSTKIIMDAVSAVFFAMSVGTAILFVPIPQVGMFLLLLLLSGVIHPLISLQMLADFRACGGVIQLLTGFRLICVKDAPVINLIPALLLVMPLSALWFVLQGA